MTAVNKLKVPEPVSGGLMLTYKCSGGCKHCMYACGKDWESDWLSEDDLKCYLSQLADKIKPGPFGPDVIGLNYGLHFTGGEPFLNFELLLRAAEIAADYKIPSTFVETNCFWCKDDKQTEDKLHRLKSAGLVGIMISVNPFVLEHVPFERTQRAIRIGRKIFGKNAIVYQPSFYHQFKRMGIRDTLSFDEYIQKEGHAALRYAEVIPMGRLPYSLGHLFKKQKAEAFFGQSCRRQLTSPYHIHIDNYGDYFGGFCGGISLGDAHNLDAICNGVDLTKRAALKALVTDIKQLYLLGQEYGYQELSDGYVSACHLCIDVRKHLVSQDARFEELKPKQLYQHL